VIALLTTEGLPVDLETFLRQLCPGQDQRVSLQAYVDNNGTGIMLSFVPQEDGKEVCFAIDGDRLVKIEDDD
jgi:hypothetical protein